MSDKYNFSASQLKTGVRCLKSYGYKYVWDHEPTVASKGYREFGGAVHEAIENYLNAGNPIDDKSEIETGLNVEFQAIDADYPDSFESDVSTCLENAAKYLEMLDEEIIGVEERSEFDLGKPGIDRDFTAIMDICTPSKLVDWKTGSTIRNQDEMIQGAVYLHGYKDLYGHFPDEIAFVYVKKGEVSHHHRVDDDGEEAWSDDGVGSQFNEMLSAARQLQSAWDNDHWPADPEQTKCNWCDFKYYCQEGQRGAEGLDWEAFR